MFFLAQLVLLKKLGNFGNDMERSYKSALKGEIPTEITSEKSTKTCTGQTMENPRFNICLTLRYDVVEWKKNWLFFFSFPKSNVCQVPASRACRSVSKLNSICRELIYIENVLHIGLPRNENDIKQSKSSQMKNYEFTIRFIILVIYFMVSAAATSIRIARDGFFRNKRNRAKIFSGIRFFDKLFH